MPAVGLTSALSIGNDTGHSRGDSVAADAAGNSYVTGNFTGTVDFDPTHVHAGNADILTSAGEADIYVAKYAPDSSLIWAVRMGGSDPDASDNITDLGRSIDVDGNGNVYVAGQFTSTGDFGLVSLTAAGEGKDGFVAKLSPGGSVLWAKRWGLAETSLTVLSGDSGTGVDTDAAGNVYVVGNRQPSSGTGYGFDIMKYSATGMQQWAKFIPANKTGVINSDLAVDAAGSVFISGVFSGTVDFDPNQGRKLMSAGPGSAAGFVLKLTSAGKLGWVSTFVSQSQTVNGVTTYGASQAQRLCLDSSGNLIVGGYYTGKVDFKSGSGTANLATVGGGFIVKLNSSGAFSWASAIECDRTVASGSNVLVYDVATDAAGNVYATGTLNGAGDFDPGAGVAYRASAGGSDAFVMKLTSAGSFAWAETFGSTGNDVGFGLAVDPTGTIHFTGYFRGTVDFDPDPLANCDLTAPGTYSSGFLVRLRQN